MVNHWILFTQLKLNSVERTFQTALILARFFLFFNKQTCDAQACTIFAKKNSYFYLRVFKTALIEKLLFSLVVL